MRRRLREETVIFISVVKWLILASVIGVIGGVSTTLFVFALNFGTGLHRFPYFFLLLPAGLILNKWAFRKFLPSDIGCGTQAVIENIHKYSGKMKAREVPMEFLGTLVTATCGGSVGKEGPSARIAAGLASLLAGVLRMDGADRRKFVICGISSGFSAVFGTPIAGAIYGLEVLSVGNILYDVLLPSFVAGVISFQVSSYLGLTYFHHPIDFVPVFTRQFFFMVLLGGIFFGFCSFIFIEMKNYAKKLLRRLNFSFVVTSSLAGVVLIILTLIFSDIYLGLGLDTIELALEGKDVPYFAFLLKALFTSITMGFGGSGGLVTPIFFIGATAGNVFGSLIGVDPAVFAAIGLVSLLAGAANTPIAASILAVELFGAEVAPYAAVSCVLSFVITGHRSVFPSQVLAMKKSASIDVEIGKELDSIKPVFHERKGSVIGSLHYLLRVARISWKMRSRK